MIKSRTLKRTGKKVYDVRLRDPSGKEYSRTFNTRGEAKAFEEDERAHPADAAHGSTHATPS